MNAAKLTGPICIDCGKECPSDDYVPFGAGVAHFGCVIRQSMTVLKDRRDGGAKVVVLSLRRGPKFSRRTP